MLFPAVFWITWNNNYIFCLQSLFQNSAFGSAARDPWQSLPKALMNRQRGFECQLASIVLSPNMYFCTTQTLNVNERRWRRLKSPAGALKVQLFSLATVELLLREEGNTQQQILILVYIVSNTKTLEKETWQNWQSNISEKWNICLQALKAVASWIPSVIMHTGGIYGDADWPGIDAVFTAKRVLHREASVVQLQGWEASLIEPHHLSVRQRQRRAVGVVAWTGVWGWHCVGCGME